MLSTARYTVLAPHGGEQKTGLAQRLSGPLQASLLASRGGPLESEPPRKLWSAEPTGVTLFPEQELPLSTAPVILLTVHRLHAPTLHYDA